MHEPAWYCQNPFRLTHVLSSRAYDQGHHEACAPIDWSSE